MPSKEQIQARLKAKFGGGARTGGKGSIRRKRKAFRKSASQDDKRLQSQLKRLNVNNIPAIEEVNLFKDDGSVVHFTNPKVQASIAANTYVVSGSCETKQLTELLPGILSHLGPDSINNLKNIAEQYRASLDGAGVEEDDDEDVPALVENFEDVSKQDDDDDDDDEEAPPLVDVDESAAPSTADAPSAAAPSTDEPSTDAADAPSKDAPPKDDAPARPTYEQFRNNLEKVGYFDKDKPHHTEETAMATYKAQMKKLDDKAKGADGADEDDDVPPLVDSSKEKGK